MNLKIHADELELHFAHYRFIFCMPLVTRLRENMALEHDICIADRRRMQSQNKQVS